MIHRSAQVPDFCEIEAKPKICILFEDVTTFQPTNFLFAAVAKVSFKNLSPKNCNKNHETHSKYELWNDVGNQSKDFESMQGSGHNILHSKHVRKSKFSNNNTLQDEMVMSTVSLNSFLCSSVLRN